MREHSMLPEHELPRGFTYPRQYRRLVEVGLVNVEPWYVLQGAALRELSSELARRYPTRALVPFARRQDNDDVACWEAGSEAVHIVPDFASPGWEQRARYAGLDDWLRAAIEAYIEFER
jgi:hypothetical protein